jgi:hypothetical protein
MQSAPDLPKAIDHFSMHELPCTLKSAEKLPATRESKFNFKPHLPPPVFVDNFPDFPKEPNTFHFTNPKKILLISRSEQKVAAPQARLQR